MPTLLMAFPGNGCLTLRGEAFYWTMSMVGLPYVLFNDAFGTDPLDPTVGVNWMSDVQLRDVKLDTTWGFRIGATYELCNWWIDASWVSFSRSGSSQSDYTTDTNLPYLGTDATDVWWVVGVNSPDVFFGNQSIHYSTIDLVTGCTFCCSQMNWGFFFGAAGAIIDTQLKINFQDERGSGAAAYLPGGGNPMTITNNFHGIGPVVGFAPTLPLCGGLSLRGIASLGALWGEFGLNQRQHFSEGAVSSIVKVNRNLNRVTSRMTMGLGLYWHRAGRCVAVDVGFGYELNYWINFVRQWRYRYLERDYTTAANAGPLGTRLVQQRWGDLALNGLNLSAAISF